MAYQSFVDRNKNVKKFLAANFETLSDNVSSKVHPSNKENFHEFLRASTYIFTKKVYATKDYTYNDLKNMINDERVVDVW